MFCQSNGLSSEGESESLNRAAKTKLMPAVYTPPAELQPALDGPREWYNPDHYRQHIGDLHSADICEGRVPGILEQPQWVQTQSKKTRKRAHLKTIKDCRKILDLRTQTTSRIYVAKCAICSDKVSFQ
jgi:hypothetical protein